MPTLRGSSGNELLMVTLKRGQLISLLLMLKLWEIVVEARVARHSSGALLSKAVTIEAAGSREVLLDSAREHQ